MSRAPDVGYGYQDAELEQHAEGSRQLAENSEASVKRIRLSAVSFQLSASERD